MAGEPEIPFPGFSVWPREMTEQPGNERAALEERRDRDLEDWLNRHTHPSTASAWAAFEQSIPVTFSSPNVICTSGSFAVDFRSSTDFGLATGSYSGSPEFYVNCPSGLYQYSFEIYGYDNFDGIITYSSSPSDGEICAELFWEIIGLDSGSNELATADSGSIPIFMGFAGGAGAIRQSGAVMIGDTDHCYVEFGIDAPSWLTAANASGTLNIHITFIREGDIPS